MYFKTPVKKHIHIARSEGQFNLLSSEKQAQYSFIFPDLTPEQIKELGFGTWYLVDLDNDLGWEDYTAVELAYELKYLFDRYFFHSRKEETGRLLEHLESIEDEQEELRRQYEIEYAKAKVEHWTKKLEQLLK
jgi:hypothetical protein